MPQPSPYPRSATTRRIVRPSELARERRQAAALADPMGVYELFRRSEAALERVSDEQREHAPQGLT